MSRITCVYSLMSLFCYLCRGRRPRRPEFEGGINLNEEKKKCGLYMRVSTEDQALKELEKPI